MFDSEGNLWVGDNFTIGWQGQDTLWQGNASKFAPNGTPLSPITTGFAGKDVDPAFKGHHETAEAAAEEIEHYRDKLASRQSLLYAEKKHSVLIVLQALDAGGKDGTVNHVLAAFNPQGAKVWIQAADAPGARP
jgi:polyphosphate kinase 2 (PPK2 family)